MNSKAFGRAVFAVPVAGYIFGCNTFSFGSCHDIGMNRNLLPWYMASVEMAMEKRNDREACSRFENSSNPASMSEHKRGRMGTCSLQADQSKWTILAQPFFLCGPQICPVDSCDGSRINDSREPANWFLCGHSVCSCERGM